jgi:hypothetical protein
MEQASLQASNPEASFLPTISHLDSGFLATHLHDLEYGFP